jgi:hypothetical protein
VLDTWHNIALLKSFHDHANIDLSQLHFVVGKGPMPKWKLIVQCGEI